MSELTDDQVADQARVVDPELIEKTTSNDFSEYSTLPLNSHQRAIVHEYARRKNLLSISKSAKNGLKIVIITPNTESKILKREISDSMIRTFSNYAKVHIPVCSVKYIDYYLEVLEQVYDCKRMYELFKKAIERTNGDITRAHVNLTNTIAEHIKGHTEYKNFIARPRPKDYGEMGPNGKFYINTNANKYFVSIDVKSANFRCVKHFCPNMFSGEWKDFVSKFTDIEFLIESKMFREKTFGEIFKGGIQRMPRMFIKQVYDYVNEKYSLRHATTSDDEVIYEVDKDFDIDEFRQNIETLLPNHFHVDMFKLVKLGRQEYYVKEFVKSDKKPDFKMVEKDTLIEVVKYYYKQPLTETDRLFEHNGRIAEFKEDLQFD